MSILKYRTSYTLNIPAIKRNKAFSANILLIFLKRTNLFKGISFEGSREMQIGLDARK